jgi:hypothetical protein
MHIKLLSGRCERAIFYWRVDQADEQALDSEMKTVSDKMLPELKKYLAAVDEVVSNQDSLFQAADDSTAR